METFIIYLFYNTLRTIKSGIVQTVMASGESILDHYDRSRETLPTIQRVSPNAVVNIQKYLVHEM